LNGKNIKYS